MRFTFDMQVSRIRERLRSEVPEDAVVLATPIDSLLLVAPSGRRVVALPKEFSNPFVSFEPRASTQRRMLQSLESGDLDAFLRERRSAPHVAAILLRETGTLQENGGLNIDTLRRLKPVLTELSREGGIALFAIANEPARVR